MRLINDKIIYSMTNYVFTCTDKLNLSKTQKDKFQFVVDQLNKIKQLDSNIESLGIPGGFVLDTLLNLEPSDLDLKYLMKNDAGEYIKECNCAYVSELINKTDLKSKYDVDIENILESYCPNNSIIEKHIGLFSHHTEFISMFALDDKGNIWANTDSLFAFENKIYNTRTEGLMAWIYYENRSFYESIGINLIRGLAYISKRNLIMGDRFRLYLEHSKSVFENMIKEPSNHMAFRKYFHKKIGSPENFKSLLDKYGVSNSDDTYKAISDYIIS